MTVTRRAYSYLHIKAVNEDKRIIRGVATTPAVDRVGDVVEPMGVKFQNPMPFLWQHDAGKPIGTVKFDEPTEDGITFEAELPVIEEAGTLKDRVDEAWQSIKLGLVRAVSIGFKAIEYAFIEGTNGIRFIESEVFELSAVTIPAQPEAVMTSIKNMDAAGVALIKSFDPNAPAATGTIERPAKTSPGASGKSHKPVNLRPKEGKDMKTLAEQITALEAKRAANMARMEEIQTKASEEGRTKDEAEREEFGTLADENDTIDEELKDLRRMEKAKAVEAKPVNKAPAPATTDAPARAAVTVKAPKLDAGIEFARLARVKAISRLDNEPQREVAKAMYGEDSTVYRIVSKAAVGAATTTDATWAGPLVGDETSAFADFVEFLRPQTILGRFGANGVPSLRRVPFRTALIGQTSGGEGYWVGEGKPKPLTDFDFSRTTLDPLKVANIAVVTEETLRDSSPSAEMIVRDQLAAALRARMDTDFINPAKAAAAGVSPASITNGISAITSSGNDADAIREDVRALFGTFIAANNAPTSGVWIMSATTALALSLMRNPLGQREFPGINMNGGDFEGLPVIVSEYFAPVSAGGFVALVNAQDVYLADEGGVAVDMSREASLQMNDAPTTQDATTGTGTSLVSLWQTNAVGFRAERTINWARRRASAVALLDEVNWGLPEASV